MDDVTVKEIKDLESVRNYDVVHCNGNMTGSDCIDDIASDVVDDEDLFDKATADVGISYVPDLIDEWSEELQGSHDADLQSDYNYICDLPKDHNYVYYENPKEAIQPEDVEEVINIIEDDLTSNSDTQKTVNHIMAKE